MGAFSFSATRRRCGRSLVFCSGRLVSATSWLLVYNVVVYLFFALYACILKVVPNTRATWSPECTSNGQLAAVPFCTSKYASPSSSTLRCSGEKTSGKLILDPALRFTCVPSANRTL